MKKHRTPNIEHRTLKKLKPVGPMQRVVQGPKISSSTQRRKGAKAQRMTEKQKTDAVLRRIDGKKELDKALTKWSKLGDELLRNLEPEGPLQRVGFDPAQGADRTIRFALLPEGEPGKKVVLVQVSEEEVMEMARCIKNVAANEAFVNREEGRVARQFLARGVMRSATKLVPLFRAICKGWLGMLILFGCLAAPGQPTQPPSLTIQLNIPFGEAKDARPHPGPLPQERVKETATNATNASIVTNYVTNLSAVLLWADLTNEVVTNWVTTSIEYPVPPAAPFPSSMDAVYLTPLHHETGKVVSNTVAIIEWKTFRSGTIKKIPVVVESVELGKTNRVTAESAAMNAGAK